MNKNLSFRQRLHNALGSQEVENVKATHAYLHAMNHSAEEWDTIWDKSEYACWAHFFGRMCGFEEVWRGSVPEHDLRILRKWIPLAEQFPEILNNGIDIRGIGYCGGLHILANSIIEVADDGRSARALYLTPGGTGDIICAKGQRQTGILWERYGSDFVYEDGRWLYLHEHVCPDVMSPSAYDKNNWGRDFYERAMNPPPPPPGGVYQGPNGESKDEKVAGGPLCTEKGPLHRDYSLTQPVQDDVPWPVPYQTLDDNNSYAKGHNPPPKPPVYD